MDFLPAWCENIERYASEVIVVDTGSRDGSYEYLKDRGYVVMRDMVSSPYVWNEGKIRNMLVGAAGGEWIFQHDPDQLWGDDFFQNLSTILSTPKLFIYVRNVTVIYKSWLIRSRYWRKDYPREWIRHYPSGWVPIGWKNRKYIRHLETGGNCGPIHIRGLGKYSPRLSREMIEPWFFHYNYLSPNKTMGVRRHEYFNNGIHLVTYFGKHPKETRLYPWFHERENM